MSHSYTEDSLSSGQSCFYEIVGWARPLMDISSKMTVPGELKLMEDEIEIVVTELTRISIE